MWSSTESDTPFSSWGTPAALRPRTTGLALAPTCRERWLGPKGLWRALGQGRLPSRATLPPWGCQWPPVSAFDQTNRPWLFAGFQFCATTDAAISIPPVCGAMFRTTWQRLQSKVCDVDSPLNLTRKGEPQKGQRGCGASVSMPRTLDSESLINGKKASYVGQNAGASPSFPGPSRFRARIAVPEELAVPDVGRDLLAGIAERRWY
jgi:hypothetical protein